MIEQLLALLLLQSVVHACYRLFIIIFEFLAGDYEVVAALGPGQALKAAHQSLKKLGRVWIGRRDHHLPESTVAAVASVVGHAQGAACQDLISE